MAAVARRTSGCKRKRISITEYEEGPFLGDGCFGTVIKARHKVTGQTVAIKSPLDTVDEKADSLALLWESGFLEALAGNPHVVAGHGVVRDPWLYALCLVMECGGQSLQSFLRQQSAPLPEAKVRGFMWQLLAGAKKMHARHVVHRDIKPGNILLADGGESLKLCDFGHAVSLSEKPPYTKFGTVEFTPPDVLLGNRHCDGLLDTWSLGCVMAELVTGKQLFADDIKAGRTGLMPWLIFDVLGMPEHATWPGFASLGLAHKASPELQGKQSRLREMIPWEALSQDGFDVLSGLLTCNPDRRLTAAAALKKPWFAAMAKDPAHPVAAAKVGAALLPTKEEALAQLD